MNAGMIYLKRLALRRKKFSSSLTLAVVLLTTGLGSPTLVAQTFTILHAFAGKDGYSPWAGVSMDGAGNLYGTTEAGGTSAYGTVYKLKPFGSAYLFSTLFNFTGGSDGGNPQYGITIGSSGELYGATFHNGVSGYGTIFQLQPPLTFCRSVSCPWTETTLYTFMGRPDGAYPEGSGKLALDRDNNLYGTTYSGGNGSGAVFELSRLGGTWTEQVIWSFTESGSEGEQPDHSVVIGPDGNLYGTTYSGGTLVPSDGVVFQLVRSGSGWAENVLASFSRDAPQGGIIEAGVIADQAGNLYGGTTSGGAGGGGTVFELTPSAGAWTLSVIYSFEGSNYGGPAGNMVLDPNGSLYGTTLKDGKYSGGSVFKLTYANGNWAYTTLHDFKGGNDDGLFPMGDLIIDAAGNLYGTTQGGGPRDYGVVFKITPQ